MSVEYGVFNGEGLLEGDMWSEEEARTVLAEQYDDGFEDAYVDRVCQQCRGGDTDGNFCECEQ